MRFVIIRRQGGCEDIAGSIAHLPEKTRPFVIRVPVASHRHRAPVGKAESGDINRIGGRMFAVGARLPAADPAAIVAAIGGDGLDRGAEVADSRSIDDLPFPENQTDCHRAAGLRCGAIGDGLWLVPGQRDAIVITALRTAIDRRQGRIADGGLFEQAVAERSIVGKRVNLARGKRPDRRGQRQRRPRHAVIVPDPFIAAQSQRHKYDQKDCAEGDGQRSCSGLSSLTVARGKSSHSTQIAGTMRSSDSHEAAK